MYRETAIYFEVFKGLLFVYLYKGETVNSHGTDVMSDGVYNFFFSLLHIVTKKNIDAYVTLDYWILFLRAVCLSLSLYLAFSGNKKLTMEAFTFYPQILYYVFLCLKTFEICIREKVDLSFISYYLTY